MKKENNAVESLIDSPYASCSTDFQNDDIRTAAELMLGESVEHSSILRESF